MFCKLKQIVTVLSCFALIFFLAKPSQAFETSGASEDSGNLLLSGSQTINDNFFAFGNLVNLDGIVKGDLFTAGNQIEINGNIENNIFAASNTITVKGHIGRDVFIAASNVIIDKNSVIEGDLSVAANNLTVNGEVKGMLRAGVSTLNVNGKIGEGIKANVSYLNFEDESVINGDVVYTSSNQAKISPNALINGNVELKDIPEQSNNYGKYTSAFISLLSVLLVGIIIFLIMPKKIEELYKLLKTKFWPCMGIGFLTLIAVPVALIILLAVIIGIPLALILFSVYIFVIYASKIIVGLVLGKLISGEKWASIWAMTAGVVLLSIIELIPILGGVASFVVILLGLGSVTLLLFTKK